MPLGFELGKPPTAGEDPARERARTQVGMHEPEEEVREEPEAAGPDDLHDEDAAPSQLLVSDSDSKLRSSSRLR